MKRFTTSARVPSLPSQAATIRPLKSTEIGFFSPSTMRPLPLWLQLYLKPSSSVYPYFGDMAEPAAALGVEVVEVAAVQKAVAQVESKRPAECRVGG